MGIRKILTVGGPREKILHAKAKKVTRFDPYLERLIADMWETMREAPGVGLAAPQIGESIRALVAEYEDEHVALINPEILKAEGEELGTEGCLSIPGLVGDNVPRAASITVKGRDPKGKEIRLHAEGWWARILQHEMDHLDGILYTDRISPRDVREVTDEDVPEEGAPVDQPARAKDNAKADGRAKSDGATPAVAAKAANTADHPLSSQERGQGVRSQIAAKTADTPARQTTESTGKSGAQGSARGGRR